MQPDVSYNPLAVLVAGVLYFLLWGIWYSLLVLGRAWMTAVGLHPETIDRKHMGAKYFVNFVAGLVVAVALAHFIVFVHATTVTDGIRTGFWAWLGFTAAATVGDYLFANRSGILYLINNGFHLVAFLAMGAILAVWH
jgi:hypothetical protein